MIKVFVYGTLMKGFGNSRLLEGSNYIGKAELPGFGLYCVNSSFPGIIAREDASVKGEIYEVDEDTLCKLDRLEGEGTLYLRGEGKCILPEGVKQNVLYYVWNGQIREKDYVEVTFLPWHPGVMGEVESGDQLDNRHLDGNVLLINKLDENEVNILRTLRLCPHKETLFMIANTIRMQLDVIDIHINKLIDLGLIQHDKRDETDDFAHSFTYFTCRDRRSEIDVMLEQDFNNSVVTTNELNERTFICMKCGTIHKSDYKMCKCCLYSIETMDTNILPIIHELNRKGYETKYCCGGHIEHSFICIYISFCKNYVFDTIPQGFNFKQYAITYTNDKCKTDDEMHTVIDSKITILKDWVKNLQIYLNRKDDKNV